MKKLICVLLCVTIIAGLTAAFAGCKVTPRDEILKIYVPGEYIDESIFEEFSKWYNEQTGNNVIVQIDTFDDVERVQLAVEAAKDDYDLLCPSDYMIEYLIKKDLLKKIDKSVIDINEEGLFKSEYVETSREFDPTLEYSIPYMYGTLGIVYDRSKTGKAITSWEALFGNEYKGKRSIKDSIRDSYAAACIYNARNELKAGTKTIQQVFEDTTPATVSAAEATLKSVIEGGAKWDVDNIKFEMAANTSNVQVAMMWSCDAGYVMNNYEDDDGNECEGNRNLWYVVPDEGGNVYIDAFVISKYAKNVTAANYFLKFLSTKEIAIQNSEFAGCISPVKAAYDELKESYENDDEMFEGTDDGWKEMFIEMMFPSQNTLARCGRMKDFGEGKSGVDEMWSNLQ